jgi:hypothetical protein
MSLFDSWFDAHRLQTTPVDDLAGATLSTARPVFGHGHGIFPRCRKGNSHGESKRFEAGPRA